MRPLIQPAVDLVKSCEGFSPTVYLCPAKKPTIGYGHTRDVTLRNSRITKAQAEALLWEDLATAQRAARMAGVQAAPAPVADEDDQSRCGAYFETMHIVDCAQMFSINRARQRESTKIPKLRKYFSAWSEA